MEEKINIFHRLKNLSPRAQCVFWATLANIPKSEVCQTVCGRKRYKRYLTEIHAVFGDLEDMVAFLNEEAIFDNGVYQDELGIYGQRGDGADGPFEEHGLPPLQGIRRDEDWR